MVSNEAVIAVSLYAVLLVPFYIVRFHWGRILTLPGAPAGAGKSSTAPTDARAGATAVASEDERRAA